jgi:thioesterase domain-containing protein
MAQQLRHQGQDVSLVVIMDIPAVAVGSDQGAATWDDIQYIIKLAEIYQGISDRRLEISRQILQGLDTSAQLNLLSGELQKIGQKLTPTSLKQLFAVYRANMLADTAYVPSLGDIPISLLRAKDIGQFDFLPDPTTTQQDPSWGWHQVSTHPIQLTLVPGNHFTMIKEPHVQALAQQLKIDRES